MQLSEEFPNHSLKEISVRLLMNKYKEQLKRNKECGETGEFVVDMGNKKRGCAFH